MGKKEGYAAMAQEDVTRTHYSIVPDTKPGYVIKVNDPLPEDNGSEAAYNYPFYNGPGYYRRIAELEYGKTGLYAMLGKTGPQHELMRFMESSGLLSVLTAFIEGDAAHGESRKPDQDAGYDKARQETLNDLLSWIIDNKNMYAELESISPGSNSNYKKFKLSVENAVRFSEEEVREHLVDQFIDQAILNDEVKKWLRKYYIFSIYEKMLWSGTERHKKYRVDADWHKMLEIVFASHYLNKGLDVPGGLYKPFTKKIDDYYYFILNHTNLGGYCYLIQQICTDSRFFDFVKNYEYGTLFSRDGFFDEKTSKWLYQLLADENNRIYPYKNKSAGYESILDNWIGNNWRKTVYPSDSDALSVKLAWAAKIIHTHIGTKYIKCYVQEENSKKQRLIIKKIDKVSARDSLTGGYYTLKPLDDTDIALLRDGRLAEAKMRYLQNKLRLINLLAYDKLGEDYSRPVGERVQICLDIINNDPQVKTLETWEQFYDDWRAKFKQQLKRLSDLIAVHLDPEYKDYGPCVLDERLEKAYAQLTGIESTLIDKKEKTFRKTVN